MTPASAARAMTKALPALTFSPGVAAFTTLSAPSGRVLPLRVSSIRLLPSEFAMLAATSGFSSRARIVTKRVSAFAVALTLVSSSVGVVGRLNSWIVAESWGVFVASAA